MSVIGSNILAGAAGQGGDYTIEESLRFNASQSSYLSRTFGAPTSGNIFTWSAWVKRGAVGAVQPLFNPAYSGGEGVVFNSSGQLAIAVNGAFLLVSTAVYRDPSAWYHIVIVSDMGNATASLRFRVYVNGVEVTAWSTDARASYTSFPYWNKNSVVHYIGYSNAYLVYADGYITEVNFIDGQALDASSFGETDATTGVWKPKGYTGTYGTNGFYLPMKLDNTTEGFNTVTYIGTGSRQQISGVGFSPDLIWMKSRTSAVSHVLIDSVRGVKGALSSNNTTAEYTESTNNGVLSFDTDGFTVGNDGNYTSYNSSGQNIVAWCWDAGSSTVSNTDGSITSSVRANPTYGFSVVSYTGTLSSAGTATVGHGLGTAPSVIISKSRTNTSNWVVHHSSLTNPNYATFLNLTNAQADTSGNGSISAPTSSVFTTNWTNGYNEAGNNYVAYCFSEVSGYSKFGSYTGTGAAGNVVTTGFKPAFVMVKRTDTTSNWVILDNTRRSVNPNGLQLYPNLSAAEDDYTATLPTDFTDTGFTLNHNTGNTNASGGTYIYMAFKDTREYAFWLDDSGNNNDWQPNGGITTSSTVTDTPTPYLGGGNYAVLNPLVSLSAGSSGNGTISDANLKVSWSGTDVAGTRLGTIGVSSGKWYYEANWVNSGSYSAGYGFLDKNGSIDNGRLVINNSGQYMCAVDMDNLLVWFGVDGVWTGDPSAGTGGTSIPDVGIRFPSLRDNSSNAGANWTVTANFGQRPFAYTPPTGFKALHTGNLPDSSIVDGSKYFNAVLYTGNTSGASVTGIGFQPDFVWSKNRSVANNHELIDVVRGGSSALFSNLTNAEATQQRISSFDSDGWTYTTNSNSALANPYVAWNWKANGTGVSNTDGSITSTVSANPTAGFSVVGYTFSTAGTNVVGHGLGTTPAMIIMKSRTTAYNWDVYHQSVGYTQRLILNSTGAATSGFWASAPTSTTFSVASNCYSNNDQVVAYCFAEVESYSKFGSYLGNGSSDGPFIYCGFRPAFLLFKRTDSAADWTIHDFRRLGYNSNDFELYPSGSYAETGAAGSARSDFLSNGFKIRANSGGINASGGTYIYMAFSENPFKNSLAR